MITKEELQEKYSSFSNSELLDIVQNKFSYTELAVIVAMEEIAKRNLNEEDIKKYKDEKEEEFIKIIDQNIFNDLSFLQKILFFYIWLPFLNFPFKRNFMDDGFELKLKQANYYSWLGFVTFIFSSIIQSTKNYETVVFLMIWMAFFPIAFIFDEFFNRQSQIRKIKRIYKIKDSDDNEVEK